MNIFGEGFPDEITKQVARRQKTYGSGYAKGTSRTPEDITFLNANTSWGKLISAVDVKNLELVNSQAIKDLGLKDGELAKKFVLFNGTDSPSDPYLRAGISNTNNLIGDSSAYGIGGTEFGLRPMMGITSISVNHENRGSLRRAEVKIKAFNKAQFEIIDILYLRLGFSVLLEWGNTMYFDNNGVFQKNSDNSLDSIFLNGVGSYDTVLKKIHDQRLATSGNYDAMFAKVTNFHWSFMPDGSYDITVNLSSVGDIIESLKINTLLSAGKYTSVKDQKEGANTTDLSTNEIIDLYSSKHTIGSFLYFLKFQLADIKDEIELRSDYIPDLLENQIQDIVFSAAGTRKLGKSTPVTDPPEAKSWYVSIPEISSNDISTQKAVIQAINTQKQAINSTVTQTVNAVGTAISTAVAVSTAGAFNPNLTTGEIKFFNDTPDIPNVKTSLFDKGNRDAVSIEWDNYGTEYYVRLGTFLEFIEKVIMVQVSQNDIINSVPGLKFDYEVGTNIMYVDPLQISVDPRICVVNKSLVLNFENQQPKTYVYAPGCDPFIFQDIKQAIPNADYGDLMNIYLNFTFILNKIDELKDDKNHVSLIDFLQGLLQGVNTALGGVNDLDVFVDETTNTVKIIDKNPLPNLDEVINFYKGKNITINSNNSSNSYSTTPAYFELYGYKGSDPAGSAGFIKDFSFTTELTPEFSTMITVGAAANGSVVGANDTALSKLNRGLEDRYKKVVSNGNLSEENKIQSVASASNEVDELNDKYKSMYQEYVTFLKNLSPTDSNIATYGGFPDQLQELNTDEVDTYKDTLTNLIQTKQQITKAKERLSSIRNPINTSSSPGTGFIPFNLSLTMDGLSGMKINQQFTIDTSYLPSNYPSTVKFLIKNISHEVSNNKWYTKLESYCIATGTLNENTTPVLISNGTKPSTATPTTTPTSTQIPGYIVDNTVLNLKKFLFPTTGNITSKVAVRAVQNGVKGSDQHRAIDIAAPKGTSVYSATDGTVRRIGSSGYGPNAVIIEIDPSFYLTPSNEKYYTIYGHLDTAVVNIGSKVKAGQLIGTVGDKDSPGRFHLHFQIRNILQGYDSSGLSINTNENFPPKGGNIASKQNFIA
jgi:murein DD-endopeptidase MepM/ murein hydrolase activator NlpD